MGEKGKGEGMRGKGIEEEGKGGGGERRKTQLYLGQFSSQLEIHLQRNQSNQLNAH